MRKRITGALHRAKRISSKFHSDIKTMETTSLNTGYPKRFISQKVNSFLQDPPEDDSLLPSFLFEEPKGLYNNYQEGGLKNQRGGHYLKLLPR